MSMKAAVLKEQGQPLELMEMDIPQPSSTEVQIKIKACAVCRTDLHILDGDLEDPQLPLILGHEIVGEVSQVGEEVENLEEGHMVGVPWLGKTCGECKYCQKDRENLCHKAQFTGYTRPGGFAPYTVADSEFCFPLPSEADPIQMAPFLCAGLIGYRSLRMAGNASRIGLYGFGAAAHILAQVITYQNRQFYAFTRPEDSETQEFARNLGATWAGGSDEMPPEELEAAIIFAPVGELVPQALKAVEKGGKVICGGIHMSDIPSFPYKILWEERVLRSVANLTRKDGEEFLQIAPKVPVTTEIHTYSLHEANQALEDLREGRFDGAAVLVMEGNR